LPAKGWRLGMTVAGVENAMVEWRVAANIRY